LNTDTWTRINIGVRGLFHIVRTEHIGLYTGMRLGTNLYSHKSTYGDPQYFKKLDVHPSAFSVQALFGFSAYIVQGIGVNTEIAIGPPYFFTIGLTYKMGGGK
jgi:hypothetical protein